MIRDDLNEGTEIILKEMCLAAYWEFFRRLKDDISLEEIHEQFVRASAILGIAMFTGLDPGMVESFSAGSVSVKKRGIAASRESASLLRKQAELMMLGYVKERDFSFRAVKY